MKRKIYIVCSVVCLIFLLTAIVSAQTENAIKLSDLFSWAKITPINWSIGALFAGLGLFGSLITVFSLIGGAVPGTAGQAKIDVEEKRLERLTQRVEDLASSQSVDATSIEAIGKIVNELRDDLRAERWRQFTIGIFLYAILGAFFAMMLAQDMLQALLIGAGWTGLLGSLGLKNDYAERKLVKDAALEKTFERAKDAEKMLTSSGVLTKSSRSSTSLDQPFDNLARDVTIAQSL